MKSYFAPKQFCLVGKAWEVQYYLRKMLDKPTPRQIPITAAVESLYLPLATVLEKPSLRYRQLNSDRRT